MVFTPGDPELVELKKKAHDLSVDFNLLHESEPARVVPSRSRPLSPFILTV